MQTSSPQTLKGLVRRTAYILRCHDARMSKGKNSDTRYVTIGGRIPLELRRLFKAQCALDDIDINTALELLVKGYVDGAYRLKAQQANILEFADKRKDKHPNSEITNSQDLEDKTPDNELSAIRAQLGMSQRAFADAIGISQSAVGNYERGKVVTPGDVLARAVALLNNNK